MDTSPELKRGFFARIAPALLVMALAPTFTELLLGGTRLTTLIAFPPVLVLETLVWGGGAVMLRALARRLGLGWGSLVLFGLAIAVAEEFVIQQTSLAPLVIRLKGVEWGRAGGINYVYALWALVYEAVWVVLMPTLVAELVFRKRRRDPWLSGTGAGVLLVLFVLGALMAWYAWTHIARVKTFHVPVYDPPAPAFLAALAVIAALFVWAIWFPPRVAGAARPPSPLVIGVLAAVWGGLWYALVILAFGAAPKVSAPAVFAAALALMAGIVAILLRWAAHPDWNDRKSCGLFIGALSGAMAASFAGFIGAAPEDLAFKAVSNLIALILMVLLARKATLPNPRS